MKVNSDTIKTYLPALTALLGVVVGGYINAYNSDKSYYERLNTEQQSALLNKRIDLIERTTRIVAKLPGIEETFDYHFNKNSYNYDSTNIVKDIMVSEKLAEYRSELFGTLTMDKLYFGIKSAKEIDFFFINNKRKKTPWWKVKEESFSPLINAMYSEMYDNLEAYNEK